MADDSELLEQLAKALRAGAVEPPAARVSAVRRLVTRPYPVLRSISGGPESTGSRSPQRSAMPAAAPASGSASRWAWADRRVTMAFSGVAAVALLVIAGVAALQIVPGSTSGRSSALLRAQNAAYRVQLAIDRQDPSQVAKADADLLRTAETLSGTDRGEIQRIAVPVHVQAVAFLRDHASPEVLSDVPGAISSGVTPGSLPLPDIVVPPAATLPPVPLPDVATSVQPSDVLPGVDGPATTLAASPVAPSVKIDGIDPRLDGNFEVKFTFAGFTPDSSGAPGTYTLRFSYDGGADATTYTGDSPWVLPLVKAIVHRQVCIDVIDAAGAVVAGGTCTNIINL